MSDPDDQTRIIRRSSGGNSPPPPRPAPGQPAHPAATPGEDTIYARGTGDGRPTPDGGTRIIRGAPPAGGTAETDQAAEPQTVLVRRPSRSSTTSTTSTAGGACPDPAIADNPVVGWLVVVEGPGRGCSLTLGYGQNPIGRDAENRVVLNFGDQEISRHKHAVLTYDPRGRKFYIQHGESTNLTYLGDEPVLAPAALNGGELIRLGDKTVLKFVPFCGDEFDWNE